MAALSDFEKNAKICYLKKLAISIDTVQDLIYWRVIDNTFYMF